MSSHRREPRVVEIVTVDVFSVDPLLLSGHVLHLTFLSGTRQNPSLFECVCFFTIQKTLSVSLNPNILLGLNTQPCPLAQG